MIPEDFWSGDDYEPETTAEQEAREAREAIEQEAMEAFTMAVRDYITTMYSEDPTVYVSDYVLITHLLSSGMEQKSISATNLSVPEGQPLIVTLGLIKRADQVMSRQ